MTKLSLEPAILQVNSAVKEWVISLYVFIFLRVHVIYVVSDDTLTIKCVLWSSVGQVFLDKPSTTLQKKMFTVFILHLHVCFHMYCFDVFWSENVITCSTESFKSLQVFKLIKTLLITGKHPDASAGLISVDCS